MQQSNAHLPSQIGLAKFEPLLGLTPIMANLGQIDKYRQTSSDIDKLRILSLACSWPVLNELGNGRIRCLCSNRVRRITMFADVNRFTIYAFMGLML